MTEKRGLTVSNWPSDTNWRIWFLHIYAFQGTVLSCSVSFVSSFLSCVPLPKYGELTNLNHLIIWIGFAHNVTSGGTSLTLDAESLQQFRSKKPNVRLSFVAKTLKVGLTVFWIYCVYIIFLSIFDSSSLLSTWTAKPWILLNVFAFQFVLRK